MAFPGRDVADALTRLGTRVRDEAVWSKGEAARLTRIGIDRLRNGRTTEQPLKRPRLRRSVKPVTMVKVSCLSFLGTMAVTLLVAGGTGVGPASVRFWTNDKTPSTTTENASGGSNIAPQSLAPAPSAAQTTAPAATWSLPAEDQTQTQSASHPRTTTAAGTTGSHTGSTTSAPLPTTSSAPTTSEPDQTTSSPSGSSTATGWDPPVETTTSTPEDTPSTTDTGVDLGDLLPTSSAP